MACFMYITKQDIIREIDSLIVLLESAYLGEGDKKEVVDDILAPHCKFLAQLSAQVEKEEGEE
jgi:hypothetical protein